MIPLVVLSILSVNLLSTKSAHAAAGARYAGQLVNQPGLTWQAWFGNYQLFADGSIVYCAVESGPPGPPDSTTTIYGSIEFVDSWAGYVGSDFPDQRPGPTITGATINRAAYILSVYGATNDNRLASVVHATMMEKFDVIPAARQQGIDDRQSEIDNLWAEATANAGPYTLAPTITGARSTQRSGDVTNIGAKSAAGNWLAGYAFTVTISGDAVFTPTTGITISADGKTVTGTTTTSPISIPWQATDTGHFSITETINGLPHYLLAIRRATDPGDQDLFATQQTFDDATTAYAFQSFQPSSSSKAVHQVNQGQEVYDTVWAQTDGTYDWPKDQYGYYVPVVFTVTAYGPYQERQPQQDHVPDGAPVAAVQQFTAYSPGEEHKVSFGSDLDPGYYHFVVSVNKADQGQYADYIEDNYFAPFAEDNETTYVVAIGAPATGFVGLIRSPLTIVALGLLLVAAFFMITKKNPLSYLPRKAAVGKK